MTLRKIEILAQRVRRAGQAGPAAAAAPAIAAALQQYPFRINQMKARLLECVTNTTEEKVESKEKADITHIFLTHAQATPV